LERTCTINHLTVCNCQLFHGYFCVALKISEVLPQE
jgi:hypothetical protein